jgi:hypothetical protein
MTVNESILQHQAEIVRLEGLKEQSDRQTAEYNTKLLLEILDRLKKLDSIEVMLEYMASRDDDNIEVALHRSGVVSK